MSTLVDKITRIVFAGILVGILVTGFLVTWPKFMRARDLERERALVLGRIEEKQHEIAQLKEYQRRFRDDPDFIEAIARQNRRVFPGELVFIFEDDGSAATAATAK